MSNKSFRCMSKNNWNTLISALWLGCLAAMFVLMSAGSASAQEFRATISGAVTDPTGAAFRGQRLPLGVSTGAMDNTVSDAAGQYVVPFLLPGQYTITAKAAGFRISRGAASPWMLQAHPIINLRLQPRKHESDRHRQWRSAEDLS